MSSIGLSSNELNNQFLTLLVTQLQNQDPIEPTKQEDFLNQLAQFSQLEGIQDLNTKFDDILQVQQLGLGFELSGKEVRYYDGQATTTGHVSEVNTINGQIYAIINDVSVPIANVLGVIG